MEQILSKLAENSLLASLLVVCLVAVYYLFGKYTQEVSKNNDLQEKRISDYKEMKDAVLELLKEIKQTTTSTLQSIMNRKE